MGGEIHCNFAEDAFRLWQLLCLCVQYELPAFLTAYARTSLVNSVEQPRAAPVLPVLVQAAEKVGLTRSERCFAAFQLLNNPEALASLGDDHRRQAQVLLSALADVERRVMGSPATPQAARTEIQQHPGPRHHC